MSKKLWYLQQLDLFKPLGKDKLEKINERLDMKEYCKRQMIWEPGNNNKAYIVKTGMVELYRLTQDGEKYIIEVLKPGSIFGDLGIDSPDDTFVEALEDSNICFLEKDDFFKLVSEYPDFSEVLIKHLFSKLIRLEQKTASLATENVFSRFLKLLVHIGRPFKTKSKNSYITDRFTHEQLAQMLGVTRQTVTTLINILAKKGIVIKGKKQIMFDKSRIEKAFF